MIFIAGASGFVGGHLIDALLKNAYRFRCLARSEKVGKSLREKGIDVVSGDITIPETIEGALDGVDFIIHLVGIIEEKGSSTFKSVHVEGTRNLIAEAKRAGVKHFFYQSALGADKTSLSGYLRTKAEAEEIVKASGIPFTIFRPSLIIGKWDGFTKKLRDIIKIAPVIPIPGAGKARLQPVYINDWVKCMLKVIAPPDSFKGIFEIGGPQQLTYNEIVKTLADVMKSKKTIIHMPMGLMKFGAFIAEKTIPFLPVSSEQLRLLETDNICDMHSVEKNFGFKPVKYKDALNEFV
ncbi:MAG: complex I NDUFA9 subunit family protein [Thermodesulfovibrionales bacterium]|nr:complex I NDUFA9 subunit family protein [Thermodesulfovibrionales bacterium]